MSDQKNEQRGRLQSGLSELISTLRSEGRAWDVMLVHAAQSELSRAWGLEDSQRAPAREPDGAKPAAGHRHKWQDGKCVAVEGCTAKPRGAGKQTQLPGTVKP